MTESSQCRTNALQLEQDLPFQYRQWRIERVGWTVIGLIVLAALSGLFGHHPLARSTVETPDQKLVIEYDRFARYESNAEIKVSVAGVENEKLFTLWVDEEYLDAFKFMDVVPVPVRGGARQGSRGFVFQTEDSRFTVKLSIQFQSFGLVTGGMSGNDGDRVLLHHLVWP